MRIDYPFRFRRAPEPVRPTLTIVGEEADVDSALLGDLIDGVRRSGGNRLVTVDTDNGLIAAHADPDRDQLIDPARGNWDFFADHPSEYALSSAVESFVPTTDQRHAAWFYAARFVLLWQIQALADQPGASLAQLREAVRGLTAEQIAVQAGYDPNGEQARRWAETVRATVLNGIDRVRARDPHMPLVSVGRWFSAPDSAILFIRAGEPLTTAPREVHAALASIRDHAMLARIDVAEVTSRCSGRRVSVA
ncbi:type IV secretion system DNA-binding domain-containing protein [uncultured Sphingomonas sp.]|mgnify:CR=1 FL=1|uniref:type IV secretion system DNA-binding domain-containing protein n=1 Tax=uncultured Sphingomonas sp. TaxID=158754 RepID=UPI00261D0253|nr:type IV secretion system DNA-binding domain-containing protein [uncultured Sphingomonas sp.]